MLIRTLRSRCLLASLLLGGTLILLGTAAPTQGYIDLTLDNPELATLPILLTDSHRIGVLTVQRWSDERGVIIFDVERWLTGKSEVKRFRHAFRGGKMPPELPRLRAGQRAVLFFRDRLDGQPHPYAAGFLEGMWYLACLTPNEPGLYQCAPMPGFDCCFTGSSAALIEAITNLSRDQGAVVNTRKKKGSADTQYVYYCKRQMNRKFPVAAPSPRAWAVLKAEPSAELTTAALGELLKADEVALRLAGAARLARLGTQAAPALADLESALTDSEECVRLESTAALRTIAPVPAHALVDYRMQASKDGFVFNYADGAFGDLELANVERVKDSRRPALRFVENKTGRKDYPRGGSLDRLLHGDAYQDRQTVPAAIAGKHGGGFELKAFSVITSLKPSPTLPDGRGDVVGLGARRFILSLFGKQAPYQLGLTVNVNEPFLADAKLDADRWYEVAVTGEPTANRKWRMRLYLDGKRILEGITRQFEAPATIPPSLILGSELYYLHSSYYRGLIGRTIVFDETLDDAHIAAWAIQLRK